MKKILIAITIFSMTFSACSLEKNPYDELSDKQLAELGASALDALTHGNYSRLKGKHGIEGWVDEAYRVMEYSGDNLSLSGTTSDPLFYYYTYNSITTGHRKNRIWENGYRAIVGCNAVIEQIEEGESEELDQLAGENYYLRALVFFQTGNIFGRPYNQGASNLSIPLKISTDAEDTPPRSTVGDVYEQVIKDLLKAEELMNIDGKAPVYASKEAAQALLARVYLYMEDYTNAELYAEKVIASGKFTLLSNSELKVMNTLTPSQNSEAIFSFEVKEGADYTQGWEPWYSCGAMYMVADGKGWGEMYPSSSFRNFINQHPEDARNSYILPVYELDEDGNQVPWVMWTEEQVNTSSGNTDYVYETRIIDESNGTIVFTDDDGTEYTVSEETEGDKTLYFFTNADSEKQYVEKGFQLEKRNGFPKWYINKISKQGGISHMWSPNVSRLSEMYLIKAESYAERGMDGDALNEVNVIRERAGIPTYDVVPAGKTALDIVMEERRLEFAFEGHRKLDVFRKGRTLDRHYPGTHLWGANPLYEIPASHDRVVEFIPEKQIVLQPSLVQNP